MELKSSCDEDRISMERLAQAKLEEARQLRKDKTKYGEALAAYLYAFDHGKEVEGWGGVYLSYIPAEIAQLAREYRPAFTALCDRRDVRENLILQGERDYSVVAEWISLNQYLGESARCLEVMNGLRNQTELPLALEEKIVDQNRDALLEQQQYDLLGKYLGSFGRLFIRLYECEYQTLQYFPRRAARDDPDKRERMLNHFADSLRRNGADILEIAAATKQYAVAEEMARRVLNHCPGRESLALLVNAAYRAGSKRLVKKLLKLAKTTVSANDYPVIERISRQGIPRSNHR